MVFSGLGGKNLLNRKKLEIPGHLKDNIMKCIYFKGCGSEEPIIGSWHPQGKNLFFAVYLVICLFLSIGLSVGLRGNY